MWQHNYEPVAGSLGVSAAVAAIPILVLFFMLGVKRKPAWMAAASALGSALLVALVAYGMPVSMALISTIYGAAFGIFPIAWIVFTLDHAVPAGGRHREVRDHQGLGRRSHRTIAGCRRCSSPSRSARSSRAPPVSVRPSPYPARCWPASGFNPFYAAGICLLANTAPVAFGSIGIPVDHAGQRHRARQAGAERHGRQDVRDDLRHHSRAI